jgi:hypothetical protein
VTSTRDEHVIEELATPATQAAAAVEPSDDVATPKRSLFRRVFRPALVWGIVGALVVAGNAWMYVVVDGWRADEAGLREQARASGSSIGESDATIAFQSNVLALLGRQSGAAQARLTTLQTEADAEAARAEAYKEVALGFERCGDQRAAAIAAIWAGGSGSSSISSANAECSSAQQQLDALAAGN